MLLAVEAGMLFFGKSTLTVAGRSLLAAVER